MKITHIVQNDRRPLFRAHGFNRIQPYINTDCFCVEDELKVYRVINRLRLIAYANLVIESIVVISDSGEYLGLIPLQSLAVADPMLPIRALIEGANHYVYATEAPSRAANVLRQCPWPLLPVLDEERRVLGVLERQVALKWLHQSKSRSFSDWLNAIGDRCLNRLRSRKYHRSEGV